MRIKLSQIPPIRQKTPGKLQQTFGSETSCFLSRTNNAGDWFLHIIFFLLPPADKSFHILNGLCHLAGRKRTQHILMVPASGHCPVVQDGHHAGVALRPDRPSKPLPQLLLHIRHNDIPDVICQSRIPFFLRFTKRVRHSEWEPYDDQRRHDIAGKVHTLPTGTRCEQYRICLAASGSLWASSTMSAR